MRLIKRLVVPPCAFALAAAAAGDVVTEWNDVLLQTIRETGGFDTGGPGPVSRAGAMMYLPMYDAINSIERTHEPYFGFFDCPPDASAEAAMATAAHKALLSVFPYPVQIQRFDATLAKHLGEIPDGPQKDAGVALGNACADACIAARTDDGCFDYVVYKYDEVPGQWVPTYPDYTGGWGPHWPAVMPWCMTSGDQFRPATGPYGYNDYASLLASPEYASDFQFCQENGAIFSKTRTEDEALYALFWANDRNGTFKPPGHLLHITDVVANDQSLSMHEKARIFSLVSLGMADAGIAAWDAKYATDIDLWRPITGIWEGENDGNPHTIGDPNWLGLSYDPSILVLTPPFPAWVSGHATFGAVHGAIMRNFFGTDEITFTVTSDDTPGYWRTFTSFDQAAHENAWSRVFLGVHWITDIEDGYLVGTELGDYISANFLRLLGDLNGDRVVDVDDLLQLINNWGNSGTGDLNDNGVVDVDDLLILINAWTG